MPEDMTQAPSAAKAWGIALRPASLVLAVGPVWVGACVVFFHTGEVPARLTLMALAAAVLMQVITNLQNDVGFTARGCAKVGHHNGLPRATANAWLSVKTVRVAIVLLSMIATALGLSLVIERGWLVLALGMSSLVAALAYMGGPKPIAYTAWGEVTVWVFFGGVAVLGTQWLLSHQITALGVLAAIALGSLSAGALAVNNQRDRVHDGLVGRHTLAVVLGAQASEQVVCAWLLAPFVVSVAMAVLNKNLLFLVPAMLLPRAIALMRRLPHCACGSDYNALLFDVFRLALCYAALLSAVLVGARSIKT